MPETSLRVDLRCTTCHALRECDEAEIVRRLRSVGMLKRDPHATSAELRELIFAAAARMTCPDCQGIGLIATAAPEEDTAWPEARRCTVCKNLIPVDRLEVFPHATTCVACQRADDQGRAQFDVEYCPKCGSPLTVRSTRGAGITRYVTACSANPPCRL